MNELTRRRAKEARQESWFVYYRIGNGELRVSVK